MVDHLIMEVDEDLRRERRQNFWRDFGTYIVTISVVVLLGTAALVGWQNYENSKREEWTSTLLAAMEYIENKKLDKADEILLPISQNADKNFKDIADIWRSQIALELNKKEKAKEILIKIANTKDSEYLSLAKILLVEHSLHDIDDLKPNDNSLLLQEILALSKLDNPNKKGEAIKELKSIADNVLTKSSARERINMILSKVESNE